MYTFQNQFWFARKKVENFQILKNSQKSQILQSPKIKCTNLRNCFRRLFTRVHVMILIKFIKFHPVPSLKISVFYSTENLKLCTRHFFQIFRLWGYKLTNKKSSSLFLNLIFIIFQSSECHSFSLSDINSLMVWTQQCDMIYWSSYLAIKEYSRVVIFIKATNTENICCTASILARVCSTPIDRSSLLASYEIVIDMD